MVVVGAAGRDDNATGVMLDLIIFSELQYCSTVCWSSNYMRPVLVVNSEHEGSFSIML